MQVDTLTQINIDECIQTFGLAWFGLARPLLSWLCRPAARQISTDMAGFDAMFAAKPLTEAAHEVLRRLVGGLEVTGADLVPSDGPLLIVANHPGLTDVLTICATVNRTDLRIVAAEYPLLRALEGINRHFIFVPRATHHRWSALHEIIAHLRGGGSVLLLPAGHIEPDPAVSADALPLVSDWSASIGLIVRRVSNLCVVPAIVSGVLLPKFQRHPLTLFRRRGVDRQQVGATLQVLARGSLSATLRLAYGPPLTSSALFASGRDARSITGVVIEHARTIGACSTKSTTTPPASTWTWSGAFSPLRHIGAAGERGTS